MHDISKHAYLTLCNEFLEHNKSPLDLVFLVGFPGSNLCVSKIHYYVIKYLCMFSMFIGLLV
jgi:hypothetical protein